MEGTGRIYLKEGQKIQLSSKPGGHEKVTFEILKVIGIGSSAVCYEAVRESDGKIGKLKEFYPADVVTGSQRYYYSLKRLDNGQLIPGKGTERRFSSLCEDYLSAYKLLNKVTAENTRNQVLKNFIQNCEILYGCLDMSAENNFLTRLIVGTKNEEFPEQATVYIWSSGIVGQSFDDYIKEIRKNPEKNADYRLHDILEVMIALTDGIKSLHTAGLLHLDIKPSNFIVAFDSDMNINASNISLFDVDTIYSAYSEIPKLAGTKGFQAPEVKTGKADNRADLYSIGATLFNAIVISDDIPDGLYNDAYYENIDQLVRHSKLIKGSESNSDVHLMKKLADILKKCLAVSRRNRYEGASQLLDDLKDAEIYAKQYAVGADQLGSHKQLKIVRLEKEGKGNPAVIMQKLLFDHPLFEAAGGESEINVLVFGCGTYSQKFMDICLQAGQMAGHRLKLTVISNTIDDDKETYLRFRPDMSRFVNIDGEMTDPERAFADIHFVSLKDAAGYQDHSHIQFSKNTSAAAREENRQLADRIIENQLKTGNKPHYIFVALGRDRLNTSIANLFSETLKQYTQTQQCPVFYVSEQNRKSGRTARIKKMYPVCINEIITPEMISADLEQISFNTHSVWNANKRNDPDEELKKFRSSMDDYASSMAFALSLKYKLFSIGIKTDHLEEAARQFDEQVLSIRSTDPEAMAKFNTLTALEHRRWILYMAADGWTAPRDSEGRLNLEECVRAGKARINSGRKHACMVFSTEKTPLQSDEYTANNWAKWDDPDIDPELDELDRMSVELHQRFADQAEKLKREDLVHNEDLRSIRSLLAEQDKKLIQAFEQYIFCLHNILHGVETASAQYSRYEKQLLDAADLSSYLDDSKKSVIEERIALIHKAYIPAIEASLYHDYKSIDADLIEKIPYILTWRSSRSFAMAFEVGSQTDGRNEEIFANAASATVLKPYRIRYYYFFSKKDDPELLTGKLGNVINYFNVREMQCEITLAIAIEKNIQPRKRNALKRVLSEMIEENAASGSGCRLTRFDLYEFKDFNDASSQLFEDMKKEKIDLYDGSVSLFHSVKRDGLHIDKITSAGIPYFEFDRLSKTFENCSGCNYLKYLRDDSYLSIRDMFALMNVTKYKSSVPEFADDYEELWSIYTGCYLNQYQFGSGVSNWNTLSWLLEAYEDSKNPIAEFPAVKFVSSDKTVKKYYFPSFGMTTISKIISDLAEYQIIDGSSHAEMFTSDECRAVISAVPSIHKIFEGIAVKPYLTHPYYGMDIEEKKDFKDRSFVIRDRSLRVRDLNLDPEGFGQTEKLYSLLKKLYEEKFITDLTVDESNPDLVSFNYASPRIKHLLTKAGEILEIYAYYEVLKTGYFDDVATGFEFEWENGGVRNELDLVLTKGFRSIIVECKAVKALNREYYHRLDSLANHFGIGHMCVMIGNTYKDYIPEIHEINETQRSRGSQLSILTISDEDSIKNIGRTLVGIMKEECGENDQNDDQQNEIPSAVQ